MCGDNFRCQGGVFGSLDLGTGVPELAGSAVDVVGGLKIPLFVKEVFAEDSEVVVVAVDLARFVDVDVEG